MLRNHFSKKNYSFLVLAVFLFLIFLNSVGWLNAPKNFIYRVSLPVMKIFQSFDRRLSDVFDFLAGLRNVSRENSELRLDNRRLFSENVVLREILKENELLRQRLAIAPAAEIRTIMAQIIGYLPQAGQYFLIDKGRNNYGLSEGLIAVTAENFFVGRIVETGDFWSKILLATDSNSLINVLTQETRARGLVRGDLGLGLAMEMIPIDALLKVGEIVLTSGINDQIPGGLILGRIEAIEKKENDIFQRAILRPAADFYRLEQVFIIEKDN